MLTNEEGITVKELKELVRELPETDEWGDDFTVWLENPKDSSRTSPAKTIFRLNDGDLLFSVKL